MSSEQLLQGGGAVCDSASGQCGSALADKISSLLESGIMSSMTINVALAVFVGLAVGALGLFSVLRMQSVRIRDPCVKSSSRQNDISASFPRSLQMEYNISISQLLIYPIKSCAGVAVSSAEVTPKGLKNDRLFMIVDNTYRFLTQRKCPTMVLISPMITEDGNLKITLKDGRSFELTPRLSGETCKVVVWNSTCDAYDQGDEVSKFISEFLGLENARLVVCICMFRLEFCTPLVSMLVT